MKDKVISVVPSKELSSIRLDHLVNEKLVVEDVIHDKNGKLIGCFCKSPNGDIKGENGWFIPIDSVFEVTLINNSKHSFNELD